MEVVPVTPNITKNETKKTVKEIIEEIQEISLSQPEEAYELCNEFDNQKDKDRCFMSIAASANNKVFCEYIQEDIHKRDSCYMNWGMNNNDYSICEKISNPNLKSSCDLLKSTYQ